jgi:hypothetical protein
MAFVVSLQEPEPRFSEVQEPEPEPKKIRKARTGTEIAVPEKSRTVPSLVCFRPAALDLLAGLEELHRANLCHGDLHSGNMLLHNRIQQDHTPGQIHGVIIDFGESFPADRPFYRPRPLSDQFAQFPECVRNLSKPMDANSDK